MKKSYLILISLLTLILSVSFISASLCLGDDRYYHDCDDDRYFDDRDNDYEDKYYYHGNYYPTRDYYYRDYYKPRDDRYSKNYVRDYYKETTEYTHTVESLHEDRYGYESVKITVSEKTEIERNYRWPYSWWKKYFR